MRKVLLPGNDFFFRRNFRNYIESMILILSLLIFTGSIANISETSEVIPDGFKSGFYSEVIQDSVKVYEIELTGEGDLTKLLQDQIDEIPDGTANQPTVIRFPKGRFWTEGNLSWNPRGKNGIINLVNRHHLIIEGFSKEEPTIFYTKAPATQYGGNVDKGDYSHRRHFRIHRSTNITVKNIRIEGSNTIEGRQLSSSPEFTPDFWKGGKDSGSKKGFPAYQSYWEFEHAFDIINSQNITIEDSSVFGVWGDGVYIGQSTTNPSENIILKNLHLKFTGRQGIAVSDARKILIENVWIEKGRRSGIDLEPFHDEGFANNVEVSNSKIDVQLTPFAAGGRGDVSDIYIHDNEFSGSGNSVYCRTSNEDNPTIRRNWRFIDNTRTNRYGSSTPVITFGWTENILIQGNKDRISHSNGFYVGASFCKDLVVKENIVEGAKTVRIYKTEDVKISENTPELKILNNG